ncbi:hypothetical protein HPB49_011388 [Dermacentor silvarum]|uniref:Uncharacterized protein n=1 Tax=Dermacentor silvarum TaxID=543639 RepID=A0ACB8DCU0_DERSI|nr:hypothetical protein HPB49_011388 [Dermacentor silvarum]
MTPSPAEPPRSRPHSVPPSELSTCQACLTIVVLALLVAALCLATLRLLRSVDREVAPLPSRADAPSGNLHFPLDGKGAPLHRAGIDGWKLFHVRQILAALLAVALQLAVLGTVAEQRQPPNIVFIFADDLGWADVSFHGSAQIPTPNMDALAADGVVLNNYYTQPVCTASRAALMTGLYPIHTGMQSSVIQVAEAWGLPLQFKLMPQHFKDIGYVTHMVGKGTHFGLDFWEGVSSANNESGHYSTTLFTDQAVKLIKSHNSSEGRKEKAATEPDTVKLTNS